MTTESVNLKNDDFISRLETASSRTAMEKLMPFLIRHGTPDDFLRYIEKMNHILGELAGDYYRVVNTGVLSRRNASAWEKGPDDLWYLGKITMTHPNETSETGSFSSPLEAIAFTVNYIDEGCLEKLGFYENPNIQDVIDIVLIPGHYEQDVRGIALVENEIVTCESETEVRFFGLASVYAMFRHGKLDKERRSPPTSFITPSS